MGPSKPDKTGRLRTACLKTRVLGRKSSRRRLSLPLTPKASPKSTTERGALARAVSPQRCRNHRRCEIELLTPSEILSSFAVLRSLDRSSSDLPEIVIDGCALLFDGNRRAQLELVNAKHFWISPKEVQLFIPRNLGEIDGGIKTAC